MSIRPILYAVLMLQSVFVMAFERVDFSDFTQATILASQGRYKQASESFHHLSLKTLASNPYDDEDLTWKMAGLADALAAISASRDHNVKAYDYWSNSIRYFLSGGTEWAEVQQQLNQYINQDELSSSVFRTSSTVNQGSQPKNTLIIQLWIDSLQVLAFKSPQKGLKETKKTTSSSLIAEKPPLESVPKPVASYAPRSLKGIKTDFNPSEKIMPTPAKMPQVADKTITAPKSAQRNPMKMGRSNIKSTGNFKQTHIVPVSDASALVKENENAASKTSIPKMGRHLVPVPNNQQDDSKTIIHSTLPVESYHFDEQTAPNTE